MQRTTDTELLRDYARHGSEAAFGEIVRRYADFVYSAALRQVSDPEVARDVAQVVFVDLARKAGSLRPNTLLIGWLCRGARLAALEQLRKQHRRLQRERQAMALADSPPEPTHDWSTVQPVLDEALAHLGEEDRNALLLRFFKNESLAVIGASLGVSEDAAQKRVSRALGKLRELLAQRGVRTTAAALSIALAANAVQSAPAGFAAALSAGALAQAAAAPISFSLLNFLASQHMKFAILSVLLAGGVAGLSVQQVKTQRQLREAQSTLQQQSHNLQSLQELQDQLATQNDELQRLRTESQEVTRLRGEVARLHRAAAVAPKASPATAASSVGQPATNAPTLSLGLTTKFVLLPTDDLKLLNVSWSGTPDDTATALLSQDQFQAIDQALQGASDVKVLGAPRIFTSSGVEASLFAGPKSSGARAGNTLTGGGVGGSSAAANTATALPASSGPSTSTGLALKVLPTFTDTASTVDLQLTATLTQSSDAAPPNGAAAEPARLESKAHLVVGSGQTLLLVKEVPADGWSEADNTVPGPKSLVVFITPSLVHTASRLARIVSKVATNQSAK